MMSTGLITKERKGIKMMTTLEEMYWTAVGDETHIAECDEHMAESILSLRKIARDLKKIVMTDENRNLYGMVDSFRRHTIRWGLRRFFDRVASKKAMAEMTPAELTLVLEDMEKKDKHHYTPRKPVELKIGNRYRLYKQNREVVITSHDNWGFMGMTGSGYDVHHMCVRPEDVKEVLA